MGGGDWVNACPISLFSLLEEEIIADIQEWSAPFPLSVLMWTYFRPSNSGLSGGLTFMANLPFYEFDTWTLLAVKRPKMPDWSSNSLDGWKKWRDNIVFRSSRKFELKVAQEEKPCCYLFNILWSLSDPPYLSSDNFSSLFVDLLSCCTQQRNRWDPGNTTR